ncbi:MAG: hypothetical protein E7Z93_03580 [Cyanobacteria bacterium SIG32]|nr:hypothetical protein [Cyanobacteria bacterium SIG32]
MEGAILQIIYILLIGATLAIFAWRISKDAKRFLGGENSLSKIHNSIIYALSYINENMMENGRFVYIRDIKNKYTTDKTSYNTTNHARMLYSLYLCERELGIMGLSDRRKVSAKYFVDRYVQSIGYNRYAAISDPEEENLKCKKAKLSSTAMALVAFSDLRGEGLIPDEVFEGMGQFLLFMQMKNGQFYNYYDIENDGVGDENTNRNFTGDAPLGLLYLYEFNPKKKWLDGAIKGLLFLANKRKDRKEVQFDYNAMLATEKLFELENNGLSDEQKFLLKYHLIKMVEQFIPKQIVNKDDQYYGALIDDLKPMNIACIIEGLIATYNCIDDDLLKMRIMKSIDTGMKFLRLAQIQKGPLKGGFPNSADWKELGVPKNASVVKMETVQHALAAFVKFQTMFIS